MDRRLRFNEQLHIFRSEGMGRFSHVVRPIWTQNASDETFIEQMFQVDVEFWFQVHRTPKLTLDDQINCLRLLGLRELDDPSDFYVYDPAPKDNEL